MEKEKTEAPPTYEQVIQEKEAEVSANSASNESSSSSSRNNTSLSHSNNHTFSHSSNPLECMNRQLPIPSSNSEIRPVVVIQQASLHENMHQHDSETDPLLGPSHPATIFIHPQLVGTGEQVPYRMEEGLVFVPVRAPLSMHCPYDNQVVTTEIKRKAGFLAWGSSFLLCMFCWPCCWIPFCSTGCKDIIHVCPLCKKTLAVVPATLNG